MDYLDLIVSGAGHDFAPDFSAPFTLASGEYWHDYERQGYSFRSAMRAGYAAGYNLLGEGFFTA